MDFKDKWPFSFTRNLFPTPMPSPYERARKRIAVLEDANKALETERDALRAAARLVLDRCTAQEFDRGAIAEALNVLAAHLPDDVLLADTPAIGFTSEAGQ